MKLARTGTREMSKRQLALSVPKVLQHAAEVKPRLEDATTMAMSICQSSMSFVRFDEQLQRGYAFCHHLQPCDQHDFVNLFEHQLIRHDAFYIEDITQDVRFSKQPLRLGDVQVRFYAGVPLITSQDKYLGMLYVMDPQPKQLDARQKKALQALARQVVTQVELYKANMQLKKENLYIQKLNQSKDNFFSIIAHDLRAPFHGLLGFSEILEADIDQLDQAGIRRIASYLNGTAKATFELLENLLQWAMSENGKIRFRPRDIVVHELVEEVCSILSSMAKNKNITIYTDIPADITMYADHHMMVSVLQNLLSNAIKFTHSQGQVFITARTFDSQLRFCVRDTGIGMSEEQIQQFFASKHLQSNKGTQGESGTGLGMLLCKRFIEKHHGHIHIESQQGLGTTFCVNLPHKPGC